MIDRALVGISERKKTRMLRNPIMDDQMGFNTGMYVAFTIVEPASIPSNEMLMLV